LSSTRADIVFEIHPPSEDIGLDMYTFAFMGNGHSFGTVTTVEAGQRGASALWGARRSQGRDSGDNLYGLDAIRVQGEVTVSVDGKLGTAVGS
jgi:hypothetical protein